MVNDDVRPFFGEQADVISAPRPRLSRPAEAHTITAWADIRVARGECARMSCYGRLQDGCCPICGWSVTEWEMRDRLAEPQLEPVTSRQSFLSGWVDEYADAQVDEDAA